ncbi:MAG: MlaD family protein [Bacteroidales bacterium]|nr:MlaD family protein [Bacteroidales bacterium]
MKLTIGKGIRLGFFIIVGIAIFASAIYIIGKQRNLFGNTFTVNGVFKDVSGLKVGNNVRYSGINVGTVSNIQLINDTLVQVQVTLEKKVHQFIREDSKMEIGTEGVMGNKVVNITSGTPTEQVVDEGDVLGTVEAVKMDEILEELDKSSVNTTVITKNIAEITTKINQGEGIFGSLFTDTSFSDNLNKISNNTAELTKNFNLITEKINQEKGIAGKMLSDTMLAKQFDKAGNNMVQSTENLRDITSKINKGEGVFGKIFTDSSLTNNIDTASQNLIYTIRKARTISDNLAEFTGHMKTGKGLIYKLLTDSAFAERMDSTLKSIDKSAKELDEAAETVRKNWFIRTFSSKKEEREDSEKSKQKEEVKEK